MTRARVLFVTVVLALLASPLIALAADPAAGHGAAASGDLMSAAGLISLLTLVALEVVLGIDNVIFIAILAGRLPAAEQPKARRLGIAMAVVSRIALLLSISWVMRLTEPLFSIGSWELSGKALILLGGGLFLIAKSTYEIHDKLEGAEDEHAGSRRQGRADGGRPPDHGGRHRVLARLGDHRRRHDAARPRS